MSFRSSRTESLKRRTARTGPYRLRGMTKFCGECGASATSRYCPECGARVALGGQPTEEREPPDGPPAGPREPSATADADATPNVPKVPHAGSAREPSHPAPTGGGEKPGDVAVGCGGCLLVVLIFIGLFFAACGNDGEDSGVMTPEERIEEGCRNGAAALFNPDLSSEDRESYERFQDLNC